MGDDAGRRDDLDRRGRGRPAGRGGGRRARRHGATASTTWCSAHRSSIPRWIRSVRLPGRGRGLRDRGPRGERAPWARISVSAGRVSTVAGERLVGTQDGEHAGSAIARTGDIDGNGGSPTSSSARLTATSRGDLRCRHGLPGDWRRSRAGILRSRGLYAGGSGDRARGSWSRQGPCWTEVPIARRGLCSTRQALPGHRRPRV